MMVLEVSAPGKDVLTCEDHEKYFSSKYDTLKCKVAAQTTFTLTAGAATKTLSIPHGLSYVPAFFALLKTTGSSWVPLKFTNTNYGGTTVNSRVLIMNISADSTNIIFSCIAGAGASTDLTVKYYIFYNQLN